MPCEPLDNWTLDQRVFIVEFGGLVKVPFSLFLEPATVALLGRGALGLAIRRRL